jgi:hypothetical protein
MHCFSFDAVPVAVEEPANELVRLLVRRIVMKPLPGRPEFG